MSREPWVTTPRRSHRSPAVGGAAAELGELFRPRLQPLADEVIDAIRASIPAYARPLHGAFGEGFRRGVFRGLEQFVELLERSGRRELPDPSVYVALGRLRGARGTHARVAAVGLPDRRAAGVAEDRRRGARGRASTPTPSRCSPRRSSPTSTSSRQSRRRAGPRSAPRPPGETERRRAALVGLLTRRPPAGAGGGRGGRARGGLGTAGAARRDRLDEPRTRRTAMWDRA